MAVTAQQIFNIAMGVLDELNNDGTVNTSDTADYLARAPSILTIGQAILLPMGEVFSFADISNSPITNLLGEMFEIYEYEGEDKNYEAVGGKAYYFELDGPGDIYAEEMHLGSWAVLKTINNIVSGTGFTAYKGVITPTVSTNIVRLRFSGSFFYRYKNIALFNESFASDNDVPDYRSWVKKSMPADFKSVSQIISEVGTDYIKPGNYKWEGRKDLYISYDFVGEMRIEYKPILTVISALTQTLQIDDTTALTCLPYYLGAELMETENPDLANKLSNKYLAAKSEARKKAPRGETKIENVYGGFDCS